MKKSLKQFVYQEMENKGYVTDQEVFDFSQTENSIVTASQYKDQWKRLESQRKFFLNKEVLGVEINGNLRKRYIVETNDGYYKICKELWGEFREKLGK